MTSRLLVALAVLVATTGTGCGADKAKKKQKKQPETTKATQKVVWEYKLVRADELVPPAGTSTSGSSSGTAGSSTGTTAGGAKVQLSDALNKLGEDGWELVWVDAPARPPVVGGVAGGFGGVGGLGGGGFGGGGAGGFGGPPDFDRMWEQVAKGKDKVDLNAPENAALKDRMTQRGQKVPVDGVVTKEMYVAALKQRGAAAGGTRVAGGASTGAGPAPTYYLMRKKN